MIGQIVRKAKKDKTLTVEFSGTIDEQIKFPDVKNEGINHLVIDANNIEAINSRGVREWVKWTKSIPKSIRVTVTRCPQVIVEQINMIEGFLPDGITVESFYVPYYCNHCGHSSAALFRADINMVNKIDESKTTCEKCGGPVEWEIIAKNYFKFLEPTGSKKGS